MKRKIFGAILLVALAVAAGWNFNQSKNEITLSELGMANVEALATPEGSNYYHKYYCGGNTSYYKCTLTSTGDSCDGPNPPYPC